MSGAGAAEDRPGRSNDRGAYTLDIVLPTARFVFAVAEGGIDVDPEHRSPEAFRRYQELKRGPAVVGMTTFPNSILLRGPRTILVDPGMELQNEPLVRALERRGVPSKSLDLIALTHAHGDHAGAVADLAGDTPVAVHEAELCDPHWPVAAGSLDGHPLVTLSGDRGLLAPGVRWLHTPGHSSGSVCYVVENVRGIEGPVVLAGDTVGPLPESFAAMEAPFASQVGERILAAWRLIRRLRPALVVAGHLPPFVPGDVDERGPGVTGCATLKYPEL